MFKLYYIITSEVILLILFITILKEFVKDFDMWFWSIATIFT